MAINYNPTNWIKGTVLNPDNMNHFEQGIKSACDGVDAMESLPSELARNGYGEQSGGKNLWNEQWEIGSYSGINGAKISSNTYIRNVNPIKVKGGSLYSIPTGVVILFYQSDGTFISQDISFTNGGTFSTPSNCGYINLRSFNAYGNDYKKDISVFEGRTDRPYEPYYESNKVLTGKANDNASRIKEIGFGNGSRNIIPFPYYHQSRTTYGITWTVNDDGSVTANGTCDANNSSNFNIASRSVNALHLSNGRYTVSGVPAGGKYNGTYWINVSRGTSAANKGTYINADSVGSFDVTDGDEDLNCQIVLYVYKGQTVNNITFYPMLEEGSVVHEYEPYYESNKILTDKLKAYSLNWRAYSDIASAVQANLSMFPKETPISVYAVLSGGAPYNINMSIDRENYGSGIATIFSGAAYILSIIAGTVSTRQI